MSAGRVKNSARLAGSGARDLRSTTRAVALGLAPLVVVLLALLQLAARANSHAWVVARMLPVPLGAVDPAALGWIRGTTERARVFAITLEPGVPLPALDQAAVSREGTTGSASAAAERALPATHGSAPAAARRVRLRLDSSGTTRVLFVLDSDGNSSRFHALGEWLAGRARLVLARDRDWIDVGALPSADGAAPPTQTRVIGLLPAPFAFARANAAAVAGTPALAAVGVRVHDAAEMPAAARDGSPGATPPTHANDPVLHEIVEVAPVALGEALRRIFFFVATGRLLAPALGAALFAFVVGWAWLGRPRRRAAGAGLLVASTVVLHATLLPPLQAADETSHAGTIEVLVASGLERHAVRYPRSLAHVARALEQERVQHHPHEILPLAGEAARRRVAATLRRPMRHQIDQAETPPAGTYILDSTLRAGGFYEPFRLLASFARKLSILDRLTLYRLLSTATGLLLAGAGLFWLCRTGCDKTLQLGYCLILLWPHAVIVLASTSNYAPAVGMGALAAAAAVAAVVARDAAQRLRSKWLAVGSLLLGTVLWADFALGAGLAAMLFPLMHSLHGRGAASALPIPSEPVAGGDTALGDQGPAARNETRADRKRLSTDMIQTRGRRRATRTIAPGKAGAIALGATMALGLIGLMAISGAGNPEAMARLARTLREPQSLVYGVVALPLVLSLLLARRALRTAPEERRALGHRARRLSLVLACAALAGFVLVPRTTIPYETRLLPPVELLATWTRTLLSTALAWDQDVLSWKFLVGAGGWHDVAYPDALHAVLRWASVALLIALPILSARRRAERPAEAACLLVLAGAATSLAALTLALRHGALVHPQGRFVMPWLVLIVLPLLARIDVSSPERILVPLIRASALIQIFAALALLGGRYAVGA